jgi:hypothetical protein
MKTSSTLTSGKVYPRAELIDTYRITDKTINNGIFRPKGHDSVWLFVTQKKTPDRTQYIDHLDGDDLSWDGQTAGRTDDLIINHEAEGLELLVFYRESKTAFDNYGFRYEGPFRYVSHRGSNPAHFHLRRVGSPDVDTAVVEVLERSQAKGQGFLLDSKLRKALEDYAMDAAKRYFESLGYSWEDHSKSCSYDLQCTRAQEVLHVEVKGTQTRGSEIILTPGEVEFARSHKGQMALLVLHSIQVTEVGEGYALSDGERHLLLPWDVDLGTLKPVSFKYDLPRSSGVRSRG